MKAALSLCIVLPCALTPLSAEEPLRPADLHGRWVLAEDDLTDDQADAAETAREVPGYGIVFTLRTARLKLSAESMLAGKWRLDDASEGEATLVIHPRGHREQSYQLQLNDEGVLRIADLAGSLPLCKMP